jgi:hypothetical protein
MLTPTPVAGPVAASPATEMCPLPPLRTRMTGVIPRRPQICDRGGLIDWPHSSSKTIQPPRPPRCFYPRPGLLLPHLDRAVVALDRPPRADLAGPAAPLQQVPDPRDGVLHPELAGDQVADPGSVHRWSCHPAASGPASSATSSAADCRHPAGTAPPAREKPARTPRQPARPAATAALTAH